MLNIEYLYRQYLAKNIQYSMSIRNRAPLTKELHLFGQWLEDSKIENSKIKIKKSKRNAYPKRLTNKMDHFFEFLL